MKRTQENRPHVVYVVEGEIEAEGERHGVGRMVSLESSSPVRVRARTAARLMLLGGAALDGPRHIWWNFVSSSAERIERAKLDWREHRFDDVPGDAERIPLPEG